jgi:hypothetical protein
VGAVRFQPFGRLGMAIIDEPNAAESLAWMLTGRSRNVRLQVRFG